MAKDLDDRGITFYHQCTGETLEQVLVKLMTNPKNISTHIEKIKALNPQYMTKCEDGKSMQAIHADRTLLSLTKIRDYYLKLEGGEYYSDQLYRQELKYKSLAESYDNQLKAKIGYSYLPIYRTQTADSSKLGNFNSLMGIDAQGEYEWNDLSHPLFFGLGLHFKRWSNIQSLSQTSPDEKRATLSLGNTWDYEFKIGLHPRLTPWRYFLQMAKYSNFIPAYSKNADQSYAIHDQRYFFEFGAEYSIARRDRDIVLTFLGGPSISSTQEIISLQNNISENPLSNELTWHLEFSAEHQWKNDFFLGYDLSLVSWGSETWMHAHQLKIGKNF